MADRASAASDERSAATLEEIVVTAQRRQQNLLDVPIAISAFLGEQLERGGIQDAQDLSFTVPSMAVQEIGPGRQIITLRGLGTQKGSSSLTGLYLDEMPLSGLQDDFAGSYLDVRTTDLERIEVLKGPQGTLFGEGSVGGTVRFLTNAPNLTEAGGKVSASVFSNEDGGVSKGASAVVNLPVVEERLGVRIAATYEDNAGWVDRLQTVNGPVLEDDYNDNELVDVRLKTRWKPTEQLTFDAMALVHRNEGGGSNIVNLDPREDSNFIIEFDPGAPTDFTDDYDLYNLTATYDLASVQLLSSTSYMEAESLAAHTQRRPIIPNPNPGFQEILMRDYALTSDSFSQELRLSSSGPGPLNWVLGAYYKDAKLDQEFITGLDFVRFGNIIVAGLLAGERPTFESTAWAVFGDVSYALTPRLEIGGGIRYFEDDREIYDALADDVSATRQTGSFDKTTFRAYLSFAVVEGIRTYASVSTGFRSGGFNPISDVLNGAPRTYLPEEVISYELGTKMRLADGRVGIEAAVFYSEYQDIQAPSQTQPTPTQPVPQGFIGNPGEAEMRGFELALTLTPVDKLTLSLSSDVTDTEVTKINEDVPNRAVFVGDPIDFVPEYSVNLGVDYGFDWSLTVPGHVHLVYSEQGEMAQTFRNIDSPVTQERTPVLHFLNAGLGADWSGWRFELFGRNLLNEDGALRPGSGLLAQARPRTFGVRFDKSF